MDNLKKKIIGFQKSEITEYHIYSKLADRTRDDANSKILQDIADDELEHYKFWQEQSKKEVKPVKWKVFLFYWISVIFGLTFGIKLMEKGEEDAQDAYTEMLEDIPEVKTLIDDEDHHEQELIDLLEEEKLEYVGSIVLGLNDALVELTGTLAGLSFALKNTSLIAVAGMITGIAASFSMGASEYLSTKSESEHNHALRSSLYTGGAYIVTVFLLILPYLLVDNFLIALLLTVITAIVIIAVFNFYISVAKDLNFKKRFMEMASISLGVAFLSFIIGFLVRTLLGVDI
ncbi:MAG: VIT1/CCC1 transporter family protein [Halanaerobiaceae bacterium]